MKVVIVGAGHNGLVAACYLAGAGHDVHVLERRDVVGGAAVTEELIPGFKVSTASYSLSLLRPDIYRDLELASYGLSFYPKDPQMFVPAPGGRHFFVWRDQRRTIEEISRVSKKDAEAYVRWGAFWDEAVEVLRPLVETSTPPTLREVERHLSDNGHEEVWRMAVAGSAAEIVESFFESDEVQGAFVGQGIIGTAAGPREPGTAWVMAYHYLGGELNGETGTWAYVHGGMGAVTSALAQAAISKGAVIDKASLVTRILVEDGSVRGVEVSGGKVLDADVVLSNAGPHHTFEDLVGVDHLGEDITRRLSDWRTPGSVVKINLALAEPPDFLAVPGTQIGPQHQGTLEVSFGIDHLEDAWSAARAGTYSTDPFMEVFMQTATDPTLAPDGQHVISAFTQYAPQGWDDVRWDQERNGVLAKALAALDRLAPNVSGSVLGSQVLGPPDLERIFGLRGGNIFHGEILPDQSFGERFRYETPIKGLFLCGSSASPGGGVMGAAGRNAARTVLQQID
ncbi:MAG TPA: NAD(P)/FAD-dependent oxidoreductase [Actinomycetota bacterium]|nr:NAD(P)/FAD-dependent oxidoreductase [Actinomycetota bacterium]